jgi:hypothetical protein
MTAKKDTFNIKPSYVNISEAIDKELSEYYARQKREYLIKYNLTELKQGTTKTSIESWDL